MIPTAATAADFELTTDQSITVADRTVQQSGNTFDINTITQVNPSDQITVTADAPADTDITMYLYDKDQNIVENGAYEGTGTTDFGVAVGAAGASEPGTYAFILQQDGERKAAHPLVVQGYSVSADAPGSVTVGDDISVEGEFNQLRGETYDQIDVIVAGTDTDTEIIESAEVTDGSFSASISTSDSNLEAGSYDVYAAVRGSGTAFGRQEILGLSTPQLLEVNADESQNTDGSEDDSNGGGGGGGGSTETTPTQTPEEDSSDTPSQTSLDDGPVTRSISDNNPEQDSMDVSVKAGPVEKVSFDTSEADATGELTVDRSSETTESFTSQFGSDRVKTAVSITVPEALASTTATVTLRLSEDELGDTDPANLQAVKNTEGGSQVLSSTTEETSDGGATVTARTPGFSEFAVITAPTESDSTATQDEGTNSETSNTESTDDTGSSDNTPSGETNDGAPGFGVTAALVALTMTALIGMRRHYTR